MARNDGPHFNSIIERMLRQEAKERREFDRLFPTVDEKLKAHVASIAPEALRPEDHAQNCACRVCLAGNLLRESEGAVDDQG